MERQLEVKDCTQCKCFASRKNIVNGDGNIHQRFMIVCDSPTPTENSTGKVFSSKYHSILNDIFKLYGLDINEHCYVTNLSKCRVPNKYDDKSYIIQDCARVHFWNELEIIKPTCVMFLGVKTLNNFFQTLDNPQTLGCRWMGGNLVDVCIEDKVCVPRRDRESNKTYFVTRYTYTINEIYNDLNKHMKFTAHIDRFVRHIYWCINNTMPDTKIYEIYNT